MKYLGLVFCLLSSATFAGQHWHLTDVRFNNEVFWPKLYDNKYHTLYCAASKHPGDKVDVTRLYPPLWLAQASGCTSADNCFSQKYLSASKDLHHLWPALPRYHQSRGVLPFAEIAGEAKRFPQEGCDFERTDSGVEPRDYAKGEIARSMLYMLWKYQLPDHGLLLLMVKWNNAYPATAEEKWRNDKIEQIQGNRNPFIDKKDMEPVYLSQQKSRGLGIKRN